MGRKDPVKIEVEILEVHEHSLRISDGKIITTIPKSQLIDMDTEEIWELEEGQETTLTIPEWLAVDRGLV